MSVIEVAFGLTVMIIGCVNHLYHTWVIKDVTTSTTKVIIEAKNNLQIIKTIRIRIHSRMNALLHKPFDDG